MARKNRISSAGAPRAAIVPTPLQVNTGTRMHRLLIGTASLGTVRMEWHNAVAGLVIPCNWSNSASTPLGFLVDDAQNLLVQQTLTEGFTWLLLLEDDVVPPADLFLKFAPYLDNPKVPVVSGLYHLKGANAQPEPLIYRGRGNGAFKDFKLGDKVWVDGVPTGCLLVHRSILEVLYSRAPEYTLQANGAAVKLRKVFQTPRVVIQDMGSQNYQKLIGTSDLYFCDQVIREKLLAKAGWPDIQRRKYPFLVDTSIACGHIDRNTGVIY